MSGRLGPLGQTGPVNSLPSAGLGVYPERPDPGRSAGRARCLALRDPVFRVLGTTSQDCSLQSLSFPWPAHRLVILRGRRRRPHRRRRRPEAEFPPPGSAPLASPNRSGAGCGAGSRRRTVPAEPYPRRARLTAAILTDRGQWAGAAGVDGVGARMTPDTIRGSPASPRPSSARKSCAWPSSARSTSMPRSPDTSPLPCSNTAPASGRVLGMRSGIWNRRSR